ncbi:uncharacterized protein PSFLO_00171 [Pseudozyma flocculosa]|uniref:Uncharacterized protein n=1 Tax=Pseudozyma flocculosa TaxID=84751 RepID=A0A5C3ES67_9BASI|nr:uncharacterized protein PSFLO_00171 [Pseudozyma flocculosa]
MSCLPLPCAGRPLLYPSLLWPGVATAACLHAWTNEASYVASLRGRPDVKEEDEVNPDDALVLPASGRLLSTGQGKAFDGQAAAVTELGQGRCPASSDIKKLPHCHGNAPADDVLYEGVICLLC